MTETGDPIDGRRRAAVAALRLDFAAGLPERLGAMGDALARLAQSDDAERRAVLHRQAHSLKGTAAAYGAAAVADGARVLEERARAWVRAGRVAMGELPLAQDELARLADAAVAFQAAVAAEGTA